MTSIPFNVPLVGESGRRYVLDALDSGHLSGDGPFTRRCTALLEERLGGHVLLTHSGTAALELAAMLADLGPGDEVIMPSFTFSSTANAVVLRGATPVFVDIRPDTQNIDETLVEDATTSATKAIVPVHYAGVCAEMDAVNAIADEKHLFVFEDAAQAYGSTYRGRAAGTLSDASAFSFHETKNVISGEGGAIWVGSEILSERAEIIREKGTNRRQFLRGAVDKYTWTDVGSSYLPNEITAALLLSQLERADEITRYRFGCYRRYVDAFSELEASGRVGCPTVPTHCTTNGHIFYILLRDLDDRTAFIKHMKQHGVLAPFHYVPLHSSPAGRRFGRAHGELRQTTRQSERLVRMPMYFGVEEHLDKIIDVAHLYLRDSQ